MALGQSFVGAGGGGGGSITLKDEGSTLTTGLTSLDVVGAGATASVVGTAGTLAIPSLPAMDLLAFWTSSAATVTASESFATTPPHQVFQREGPSGWITNASALPQWIQIQFPQAVIAKAYAVMPWYVDNYPGRTPKTWTLAGSNDGSTFTTLDSQTNFTTWPTSTSRVAFSFTNTTAYAYYRWTWSANNGNAYTGVGGLWLFGQPVLV